MFEFFLIWNFNVVKKFVKGKFMIHSNSTYTIKELWKAWDNCIVFFLFNLNIEFVKIEKYIVKKKDPEYI